jgi:hypothetical protein
MSCRREQSADQKSSPGSAVRFAAGSSPHMESVMREWVLTFAYGAVLFGLYFLGCQAVMP